MIGVDYYTDARHSEIDPVLKAKNEAEEAPMRELGRWLIAYSDGYLRSQRRDAKLAIATLDGLFAWAAHDALLGRVNRTGLYQLKWALAAYALDYLKIRDEPALDPSEKQRVEIWFRRLADQVVAYQTTNPTWPDHWNNHAYWAALAVATAGVAVDDRALFDWGIGKFDIFLNRVRPDGSLPDELARGKRALHYHLFSVAPLVMLAELAEANGVHLYRAGNRALERLATRCLVGLADPSAFGVAAGAAQVIPEKSDLAWIEPYYARSQESRARTWLSQRPLSFGFLGGDLTLAFGVPVPDQGGQAAQRSDSASSTANCTSQSSPSLSARCELGSTSKRSRARPSTVRISQAMMRMPFACSALLTACSKPSASRASTTKR
ncbi:MAG: alginate lyase family protein [Pseudomonadota bacterium]